MIERIFLIGFMGTGKTTVGSRLASALDWKMYDSDQEIVKRVGRSIPEIFAAEGEAFFRKIESSVLAELSDVPRVVITTGGGAVLSAANRELMQSAGHVVRLTASIEELVRRVSMDSSRPLLQTEADVRTRVEQLIRERAGLYDFADLSIETTGKEIETIVSEILEDLSAQPR